MTGHDRLTVTILLAFIALSFLYPASLSLFIVHRGPSVTAGWKGSDLSGALLTPSSSGKLSMSLNSGGMNISLMGNASSLTPHDLYGAQLETGKVSVSKYSFFQIWIRTNSVFTAGVVSLVLESGTSVTVLRKTYDDALWHLEVVYLNPFGIPRDVSAVGLFMGFERLTPAYGFSPAVDFSGPEFDSYDPSPSALMIH